MDSKLKPNGEAQVKPQNADTRNLNAKPSQASKTAPMSNARKPTASTRSRLDQVVLTKEMGARLRESRDMAGMNQKDAAKRLGYQNSSKLAKIEKGQGSSIPLMVLRDAAIMYDVSLDYIFGITATMERDDVAHAAFRELSAFMFANFDKRHAQDVATLTGLLDRIVKIEKMIVLSEMQANQLIEAFSYITPLPEWQDVRGGNRLDNAISRLCGTVSTASKNFKNIKKEMQTKAGCEFQMNLLLEV